jgi:hypothetical protein
MVSMVDSSHKLGHSYKLGHLQNSPLQFMTNSSCCAEDCCSPTRAAYPLCINYLCLVTLVNMVNFQLVVYGSMVSTL